MMRYYIGLLEATLTAPFIWSRYLFVGIL